MVKVKLSNFELLKVVAMLMIVCHHLITQNAFNIDTQLTRLNASRMFCQFIGNHAFVGNNVQRLKHSSSRKLLAVFGVWKK